MEFIELNNSQDNCPIVLIDNSSSTSSRMRFKNDESGSNSSGSNSSRNVLEHEMLTVQNILKDRDISNLYLMLWNSGVKFPFQQIKINLDQLKTYHPSPGGCTDLEAPLKALPEAWYQGKDVVDLYIITDGEINGGDPRQLLRKYINMNFKIHIITIEPNNASYLTSDCQAGNSIYGILNSECLMNNVREFVSYNCLYLDGFVSIDNPDKVPGYYVFQGKYFKVDQVTEFIKHLDHLVQEITSESDSEENQGIKLLKLAHEISYTLSQMVIDKPLNIKKGFVNMISQLFLGTPLYKDARRLLLGEAEKIQRGQASTFQDYRRNRTKVFERAQMSLYSNVLTSIGGFLGDDDDDFDYNNKSTCMSMIINDNIIMGSSSQVTSTISFGKDSYQKAAFKIGNYSVPVLPTNVTSDDGEIDQCLRQWIRANYSRMHNVNVASDQILYYFLTDALRVCVSDVDPIIKKAWKDIARVMLDRKRFGTDVKEYHYLIDNNPPAPVTGSADQIVSLLKECVEFANLDHEKVAPMTLWYGIVKMFWDDVLNKAQLSFCQEDLALNQTSDSNVHSYLSDLFKPVKTYNIDNTCVVGWEYFCPLTETDTSDNGGWTFEPHQITDRLTCAPKYVISYTAYAIEKNKNVGITCPLCQQCIPCEKMNFVKGRADLENEIRAQRGIQEVPDVGLSLYDERLHEVVSIGEAVYKTDLDHSLTKFDDLDFTVNSYEIDAPTIHDALGNRKIEITSQEEFNHAVETKYPFLKDLDMTGACLAGGFCRSVLLKQRLKDLDFFFYGYGESEEEHSRYLENFRRLLNDICQAAKKWNEGVKFLVMYKPLFNVFEVICVTDPDNFLKNDYTLDNFKQYDFKSLHRFDKLTIIDPETGKVYRRKRPWDEKKEDTSFEDLENRDFTNYFEDGDVTGVKMILRIQFILAKFKTKEDILENFDMYPCQVLYDGQTTYFTKKAHQAYKYMINVVNENNYSDLFDYRLSKYFAYGFSIVLPELELARAYSGSSLTISKLTFRVNQVRNKLITVEKNSQIKQLLDSLQHIEKKNADKGKALYKSALFCSLVSVLRYVKINDINYIFTDQVILPEVDGQMKFRESTVKVHFINKINSRKPGEDLYGAFRKDPDRPYASTNWFLESDQESDSEPF